MVSYEPDDAVRIKGIAVGESAIEELEAKGRRGEEFERTDDPLHGHDRNVKSLWTERLRKIEVVPTEKTISGAIADYLRHRLSDVGGKLTADSYDAIRCRLQLVKAFRDGDVTTINEDYVEEFWDSLKAAIKKKERSADYCQSVFTTFKMFVRYLWKKRRIEMPRNFDLYIDTPEKEIVVWETNELKKYFAALNDRTKLYALLMLNCGAYDSDIADLKTSEVDWKQGRIIRKRSKSADEANAPKVNWKLWPETFRLLKQERAKGELALLNQDGGPLRSASIGDDGKLRKSDNIRSAMTRVCRLLKIKKTPKQLRKTASSKLDKHDTYGRYALHFLGHAPPTVGGKHYITPSQDLFDNAVEWLGKQFGF